MSTERFILSPVGVPVCAEAACSSTCIVLGCLGRAGHEWWHVCLFPTSNRVRELPGGSSLVLPFLLCLLFAGAQVLGGVEYSCCSRGTQEASASKPLAYFFCQIFAFCKPLCDSFVCFVFCQKRSFYECGIYL